MSTTGEPSIEAAERLQGRTVEDSAAKQLPVPNVPDLSAFDMNGNLHMTSESMEKLHQPAWRPSRLCRSTGQHEGDAGSPGNLGPGSESEEASQSHPPYRKPSEDSCEHLREDRALRYEATLENMERYILDIAGIRVICPYIQDVYSLFELLNRQDDLEIVKVKDTSPRRSRMGIAAFTLSRVSPCSSWTRRSPFPWRSS